MRTPTNLLLRSVITALLACVAFQAHADDDSYVSAMRYVSLDVSGDNADSRQYSGTGSFAIGKYMWLQGTAGKLTDQSTNTVNTLGDLKNYGAGAGFKNEHVQLSVNFSNYKNDTSYRQRDVTAALDWNAERFSVGLDLMRRTTDDSLDTVRNFTRLNLTNVALHVDETLTGNGIGLHANFQLTDALSLSLGGMSYSYSSDYTLTSSTNPTAANVLRNFLEKHPTVSNTFYLNNSGLTRSLALLDSSYNLGLSYQFSAVGLNAQYARDEALDTGDITDTFTLGASIFVGDHWMLSPLIGQSKNDTTDGVTFGGLSVSYNW
jgi:hypothetical protein